MFFILSRLRPVLLGDVSCLKVVGISKMVVGKSKMVVGKSQTRALPERALPERVLPERACQREPARENLPERAFQRELARETLPENLARASPARASPLESVRLYGGNKFPLQYVDIFRPQPELLDQQIVVYVVVPKLCFFGQIRVGNVPFGLFEYQTLPLFCQGPDFTMICPGYSFLRSNCPWGHLFAIKLPQGTVCSLKLLRGAVLCAQNAPRVQLFALKLPRNSGDRRILGSLSPNGPKMTTLSTKIPFLELISGSAGSSGS